MFDNHQSVITTLISTFLISYSYFLPILNDRSEKELIDIRHDSYVYQRIVLPKYYATVNQVKRAEEIDYRHLELDLGSWDDYEFQDELGSGASGTAYTGKRISTGQKVVIKTFFEDGRMRAIKKEIKLLRTVHDHPYICELVDVIKAPDTGFYSIVYNFYKSENEGTSDLFMALTDKGNRFFLYKVLRALDYAHSKGVIHGDIKPLNIIANSESKMLKIIDWGLGNFYIPGTEYSVHVGTRSYKSPELLLNYSTYDYAVDIFATGLMFSKMLYRRGPLFPSGTENWTSVEHLIKLTKVLGTKTIMAYVQKYNMHNNIESLNLEDYPVQNLKSFINSKNEQYCDDDAIDLLKKMLIVDHVQNFFQWQAERITAKDALKHPYFDSIRDMV